MPQTIPQNHYFIGINRPQIVGLWSLWYPFWTPREVHSLEKESDIKIIS